MVWQIEYNDYTTRQARSPRACPAACTTRWLPLYWVALRSWSAVQEDEDVPKRTYQPKRIPRRRRHGFLHRMASAAGRSVLRARRLKGRKRLVVV
jgi:large subunit ribosomal protein L34